MTRKKWDLVSISKAFDEYRENGGDIRSSAIQKEQRALFCAICKYHGSYKSFIEKTGLDYSEISSKRGSWTKQQVMKEFLEYAEQTDDLRAVTMQTVRNDLYIQIGRKYGAYRQFLESLGYDTDEIYGFKLWNNAEILEVIQERHLQGYSVSYKSLHEYSPKLVSVATKRFGSLRNAVELCGINYDDEMQFTLWNKDLIKEEFLKFYYDESITRVSQIREANRGLDHAIRNHFGGYDVICAELGLEVSKIRAENVRLTKDEFIAKLTELKESGVLLNPTSVYQYIPTARSLADEYFGNYANALSYIGVDINDYSNERLLTTFAGREFEKLLAEMFVELGKDYEYQYRGFEGIIPDFYDNQNNVIIDAKLSSWSVFNCDTLEKYLPKCERLIIVHLRGSEIEHNTPRLEIRNVSEYYEVLREKGLTRFIDEFERIKLELNNAESTQEKAVV